MQKSPSDFFPGFCVSCIGSSFTPREYGCHQNWAVFTFFGVTRKPLRCLWTMFHYSLWSYIPDPLHHMDNNTSICTTQALHLGLQSQVWLSIQQPLQPPVTCLCIALCVMKPNGLPAVFSAPLPQLQVLRILPAGCALAGTGAEEGRASRGQWPPQFQCPI